MNETALYNAARLLETRGYNAAINYVRGHVRGCIDKATAIVDKLAEGGE